MTLKRFLRFSIRLALIVTLLVACLFAYQLRRYRAIRAANIAIKELGGSCGYSIDGPNWLRKIVNDDNYFLNPVRISLGTHTGNSTAEEINDAVIADAVPYIRCFSKFEVLDLRTVSITDQGVASLKSLPTLKYLRISSRFITDQGLETIELFPALEELLLECDGVSDEAIRQLQASRPSLKIE